MSSRAASAVYPELARQERIAEQRKPDTPSMTKPTWAQSNDPMWSAPRELPPDFWWVEYHRKVKR
jgi:hypothetical protein